MTDEERKRAYNDYLISLNDEDTIIRYNLDKLDPYSQYRRHKQKIEEEAAAEAAAEELANKVVKLVEKKLSKIFK